MMLLNYEFSCEISGDSSEFSTEFSSSPGKASKNRKRKISSAGDNFSLSQAQPLIIRKTSDCDLS
jgi:hypothetical protein